MAGFNAARKTGKVLCCLVAAVALPFLSSGLSRSQNTEITQDLIEIKEEQMTYNEQVLYEITPVPTTEDEPDNESESIQISNIAATPETGSTPAPEIIPDAEPGTAAEENIFTAPSVTDYTDGITRGSIRYVSQLNDVENNGWGKYSWKAGMECTTACISMALSYLGLDASPETILDYSSKTVLRSCYGMEDQIGYSLLTATSFADAEESFQIFQAMFDEYTLSKDTSVSPVLVYISGNGNHHAILVIGQEDDAYLSVDPTPAGIHRINIAEDGKITSAEEGYLDRYTSNGTGYASIASLAQWYLIKEN